MRHKTASGHHKVEEEKMEKLKEAGMVTCHKTASGHHKVEYSLNFRCVCYCPKLRSQNRKRSSQGRACLNLYLILDLNRCHKTASGHHKVEGRAGNPHHRRLKKAFLKNKQTFFCRINKIRLHTMT